MSMSDGHLVVSKCVSYRELSRSTAPVMNEVERDGSAVAISRYGRIVALVIPVPERVTFEFEGSGREATVGRIAAEPDPDLDEIELTELGREFLVDAASTPTGNWRAPDRIYLEDPRRFSGTLHELHIKDLAEWQGSGRVKITRKGRSVAQVLRDRGQMGYDEMHALSSGEAERGEDK